MADSATPMVAWLAKLLGNKPKEKIYVGLFVLLLLFAASRAVSAEPIRPFFEGGSTFIHGGYTPVAGFGLSKEFTARLSGECEIGLVGSTEYKGAQIPNNAFVSCQAWLALTDKIDTGAGAGVLQNKDLINGSRGNFRLGLRWNLSDGWYVQLGHFSNAGTRAPNKGRNWLSIQKVW